MTELLLGDCAAILRGRASAEPSPRSLSRRFGEALFQFDTKLLPLLGRQRCERLDMVRAWSISLWLVLFVELVMAAFS